MTIKECYTILGIEITHDVAAIKTAFRTQASRLHPDKNPDPRATQYFIELKEAFDTVMLYLEIREKYGSQLGQMLASEEEQDIQERVRVAREKRRAKRAREERLVNNLFDRYTRSWRIYACGILALLSACLAFMIVSDFATGGEWECARVQSMRTSSWAGNPDELILADFYIKLRNREIPVEGWFFMQLKENSVVWMKQTRFLGEIHALRLANLETKPLTLVVDGWVVLVIGLCIPLLSFVFVRRTFTFVFFFINYNMYVQPLLIGYILFSNNHIAYIVSALSS